MSNNTMKSDTYNEATTLAVMRGWGCYEKLPTKENKVVIAFPRGFHYPLAEITPAKRKGFYNVAMRGHLAPPPKTFRVISVSSNSNSFGLRGVVMAAPDGEAYEAGAAMSHREPICAGQDIVLQCSAPMETGINRWTWVDVLSGYSFEIPRALPALPEAARKILFA